MKIALDAMGGDHAPQRPVEGAILALREYQQISKLFLVGDERVIEQELLRHDFSDSRLEIVNATEVIGMEEKAAQAVRRKKKSSISISVDLVKTGDAEAVVSAGNTGAMVAATTIKLRTLPGVDRPGIAAPIPTESNVFIIIDAGANIDPRPRHLLQYAVMGSVYSKHVLRYPNPSIGLMSVGEEDVKGSDFTREVFKMLRGSHLNFRGNIEGHDLFENPVEVVVCDGFVGNVVLKTCEAIAHAIFRWLKHELKANPIRYTGAMMAKGAFQAIRKKTNPEEYGGSPLLGVNGICIIAHGGSTAIAIKNAIRVAAESIQHQVNPHIVEEISRFNEQQRS
jgi:glycerol-3-phosphate acyltransferase PlsX